MSRWLILLSGGAVSTHARRGLLVAFDDVDNAAILFRPPCLRSLIYQARELFEPVARALREKETRGAWLAHQRRIFSRISSQMFSWGLSSGA